MPPKCSRRRLTGIEANSLGPRMFEGVLNPKARHRSIRLSNLPVEPSACGPGWRQLQAMRVGQFLAWRSHENESPGFARAHKFHREAYVNRSKDQCEPRSCPAAAFVAGHWQNRCCEPATGADAPVSRGGGHGPQAASRPQNSLWRSGSSPQHQTQRCFCNGP
jgi:hypothetical protein